jgi:hypothetical protein
MNIYEEKQMVGLSPHDQAKKAIGHVLGRIAENATVRYQLGIGTQTFSLLTEAYDSLTGGNDLGTLRHNCLPAMWEPGDSVRLDVIARTLEHADGSLSDFEMAALIKEVQRIANRQPFARERA